VPFAALLLALGVAVAGCGGGDDTGAGAAASAPNVRVILDFVPNAVHAPLFAAARHGDDRKHGLQLDLRPPGSTSDTLKLVAAGGADFGIADLIDLALARERGEPFVAVAAIVQRPTSAVLTLAGGPVRRPRDLAGRKVGLTGVPSDPAIVRSVIRADGGNPDAPEYVTIGFNAVPSLIAGAVDASIGFWPAEGVQLESTGHPVRTFKLDDYGAPPFPELVLFTREQVVHDDPGMIDRMRAVLVDGYRRVEADPNAALDDLAAAAPGLDRAQASAQLDAYRTIFTAPGRPYGTIDAAAIGAFCDWLVRAGVSQQRIDPAALARP
jgi:NitT/TauT family transport system substrate-binding protein/putative hydroxymethylpyrimidine transport system substrate-binding protein